jgi:hypothetical protein
MAVASSLPDSNLKAVLLRIQSYVAQSKYFFAASSQSFLDSNISPSDFKTFWRAPFKSDAEEILGISVTAF